MLVTFLIPCLNESKTIVDVIKDCHVAGRKLKSYEIVVADNGSKDGSQDLASLNGAKVINVKKRGYGAALSKGIKESSGKYIVMGDADRTYDFKHSYLFISFLRMDLI